MTVDTVPLSGEAAARAAASPEMVTAIKAVESEFSELMSRVRRIIAQNAERVSPGLSPGGYKIFTSIVRHGPVKAADISERMMLDKGQMSRTVRELEDVGLITRRTDEGDRRVQLLEATRLGINRLDAARSEHESVLYDTLLEWDIANVRELARLLHALTVGTAPRGSQTDE